MTKVLHGVDEVDSGLLTESTIIGRSILIIVEDCSSNKLELVTVTILITTRLLSWVLVQYLRMWDLYTYSLRRTKRGNFPAQSYLHIFSISLQEVLYSHALKK